MSEANKPVITRAPRENETREKTERPTSWKPASALPEVGDRPGWRHRWVRKTMYGQADPINLSKKRREGWEPVRSEDYPELADYVDYDARNSGLVEIGGLVLHRITVEAVRARQEFYAQRNQQELKSAEAMYQNSAGAVSNMPIFKDNKTQVKFGSGQ